MSKPPKQHLTRCPICRELFNQRQIERHIAAKHPQIKHPKGKR